MIVSAVAIFLQTAVATAPESIEPAAAQNVEAGEQSSAEFAMPDKVGLRDGTQVRLRLLDELSTRFEQKGQTFELEVIEDVRSEGWLLIPAGSRVVGEVTRSDAKGAFGKSGKLEARILYLKLDGRSVRLSESLGAAGKGGTTGTVLSAIAAGTLAFVVTGKTAVIEVGTELVATIDRPISLRPLQEVK